MAQAIRRGPPRLGTRMPRLRWCCNVATAAIRTAAAIGARRERSFRGAHSSGVAGAAASGSGASAGAGLTFDALAARARAPEGATAAGGGGGMFREALGGGGTLRAK